MTRLTFLLVLASVGLNAAAQLLLKAAAMRLAPLPAGLADMPGFLPRLALNPFLIAGLACYVLSVGVWLAVLAKLEVSAAYPFVSIGYVIAVIVGYFYFNEAVTLERLFGVGLICAGLFFIARSA